MRGLAALSALVAVVATQDMTLGPTQSFDIEPTQRPTSIGDVEPSSTATVSGPIETSQACGTIANLVGRTSRRFPSVEADLAYACLKSVPIKKNNADFTVDAIKQMVEFQSTLTYLKDPPTGWPNEPVDLVAGLNNIQKKLNDNEYTNEYDFETDIAALMVKAHDGHLNFNGMAYSGAFRWRRSSFIALISASKDGSELPKIFAVDDFNRTNAGYDPSPITQIDGKNVVEFLEEEAKLNAYHDPDTRYNAMFFMQPAENYGYFTNPRFYPGAETSVTYENGTTRDYQNAAVLLDADSWGYIDDPESFYDTYINPQLSAKRVKKRSVNALPMHLDNPRDHDFSSSFSQQHGSIPLFYPKPFVAHSQDLVPLAGYFINTAQGEIGVLVVQTFNTDDVAGAQEFQMIIQRYIAEAQSRGVEKHIIDVRTNGGGKVLSGYDMYLQFFPSQVPQTQSRWRGHKASELFGEKISTFTSLREAGAELFTSPFSNDAFVNSKLEDIADWSAMYPPDNFHNDKFTTLLKYNLSDPLTTSNERSGLGITITGYNTRSNFTTDPFKPENLIILSDGICASTCSIFLELMVQQSNVRTLAIGGRPNLGPMVPVGGTKGTLVLPSVYLQTLSGFVVQEFAKSRSEAQDMATYVPNAFGIAVADASVNFQDNIRAGLESAGVPTQFLNDTASCRIWYQPDMYLNVSRVWEETARVAFGGQDGKMDEGRCVAGSVTNREQQTGQGEGNPSGDGNAKKDAGAAVRPGWRSVFFAMGVVVVSWVVL